MDSFRRSTAFLLACFWQFFVNSTAAQQLARQDRPFLLKIGEENCACLGAETKRSLRSSTEIRLDNDHHQKRYSCSCSSLNNSNLQAQDLQTVLQNLHAGSEGQGSCRCDSAPSILRDDDDVAARTRRAPYPASQWQCSCGNSASPPPPLYYREPSAPYYLADVPSKYFLQSSPIQQQRPMLYQIIAKSKTRKAKDPTASKVVTKEEVKEAKKSEKSYDFVQTKNGAENGASKCPCFDIILKFQRNSAEDAKTNVAYLDEKHSAEANCACQQFLLMDNPPKPPDGVGVRDVAQYDMPLNNNRAYTNYDDIIDEHLYNHQQQSNGHAAAGSMPCVMIRLNSSPQQQSPLSQQPCACQKDYIRCAANACCPATPQQQQVSRDEMSKARANVDLLMNFLSKFKENLVR